ncbi:Fur family transcriptional regulator [Eubacterium xylanophilum]|uniref:Fur family transcriptional regulator n=1 Tax=Eubacterium xylanophilum TaxID=39497 RepID=UPI0004B99A3A|nr:transcriptional repressor [Eubacterium xylanophilum]
MSTQNQSRSKYKTKQRDVILSYLKTVPGQHITASDACLYFKEQGIAIGQSTIYRQLENLVDEGILNKYIIDANTPACFEYIQREEHCDHDVCFHCKCEKCGKLIHMHCDELKEIGEHLMSHHEFKLDPKRTVFYGVCEDCR